MGVSFCLFFYLSDRVRTRDTALLSPGAAYLATSYAPVLPFLLLLLLLLHLVLGPGPRARVPRVARAAWRSPERGVCD